MSEFFSVIGFLEHPDSQFMVTNNPSQDFIMQAPNVFICSLRLQVLVENINGTNSIKYHVHVWVIVSVFFLAMSITTAKHLRKDNATDSLRVKFGHMADFKCFLNKIVLFDTQTVHPNVSETMIYGFSGGENKYLLELFVLF